MMEKIILFSDHTWYTVLDKEQAQRFVNNHKWDDGIAETTLAYGIYIEPYKSTILYRKGDE